jgi:hypothetical protein
MRANYHKFPLAKGIIILVLAALIGGCSKKAGNGPVVQLTNAEILVQAGKWVTTGGTLVAADSTSITLPGNDPFFGTILLGDVTFFANGTAVESNDPNGLTANGLTWKLSGPNLLVNVNDNNTDKVRAVITYLSEYKLVMNVSDFYVYNGVTYVKLIQTMQH